MMTRPGAPPCYDEHVALSVVLHSLHWRVVALEQKVAMLEKLAEEKRDGSAE